MSNYLFISDAAKEVKVESHVLRYWEEELHLPIKRNELGHRYYTEEDVERFKQIKGMKERGLQLKAIKMILRDGKLDVLQETPMDSSANIVPSEADISAEVDGIGENIEMSGTRRGAEIDRTERNAEFDSKTVSQPGVSDASMPGQRVPYARASESGMRTSEIGMRASETGMRASETVMRTSEIGMRASEMGMRASESGMRTSESRMPDTSRGLAIDIVPSKSKTPEMVQESKEDKSRRLQWILQQLIRQAMQENNSQLCREIRESVVKELDYQFRMQEEREEARDRMLAARDEEHYKRMDEVLRKKSRFSKRQKQEKKQEQKMEKKQEKMLEKKQETDQNNGKPAASVKKKRRFI